MIIEVDQNQEGFQKINVFDLGGEVLLPVFILERNVRYFLIGVLTENFYLRTVFIGTQKVITVF